MRYKLRSDHMNIQVAIQLVTRVVTVSMLALLLCRRDLARYSNPSTPTLGNMSHGDLSRVYQLTYMWGHMWRHHTWQSKQWCQLLHCVWRTVLGFQGITSMMATLANSPLAASDIKCTESQYVLRRGHKSWRDKMTMLGSKQQWDKKSPWQEVC